MAEYWDVVLAGCDLSSMGFCGTDERRKELAALLATNEFTRWHELQDAEHPSKWLGGNSLLDSEVDFLVKFAQMAPTRFVFASHSFDHSVC